MRKRTSLLKLALIVISLAILLAAIFVVPVMIQMGNADLQGWGYPLGVGLYVLLGLVLVAIGQSWHLLRLIEQQAVFSTDSVVALTWIKRCAYGVTAIFVVTWPLFYVITQATDAPGILLMAIILTGIALIIGIFASILAQLLANAVQLKHENELTI
jgi:hypothetical protein